MKKSQITRIKQILLINSFKPTKLLKGDSRFAAPFKIERPLQQDFDIKTVLYEGLFQNKKAIIKIYLNPQKEFSRFERELYVYLKIRKQVPVWNRISVKLFDYGNKPLPFLVLERLVGSPLGDWFHIKQNKIEPLINLLEILPLVYKQTKLPKKYAYSFYNNPDFLLKKTKKIKRTLKLLKPEKALFFWQFYHKLGTYLKKRWNSVPSGFIFSDLNPANIFLLKEEEIRIVDFDAISIGKKTYDYAFLYYAAIGSKIQPVLSKKIADSFRQTKDWNFFFYFLFYLSLTHSWSFVANHDLAKFNAVIKEIEQLLKQQQLAG